MVGIYPAIRTQDLNLSRAGGDREGIVRLRRSTLLPAVGMGNPSPAGDALWGIDQGAYDKMETCPGGHMEGTQ